MDNMLHLRDDRVTEFFLDDYYQPNNTSLGFNNVFSLIWWRKYLCTFPNQLVLINKFLEYHLCLASKYSWRRIRTSEGVKKNENLPCFSSESVFFISFYLCLISCTLKYHIGEEFQNNKLQLLHKEFSVLTNDSCCRFGWCHCNCCFNKANFCIVFSLTNCVSTLS